MTVGINEGGGNGIVTVVATDRVDDGCQGVVVSDATREVASGCYR